MGPEKVGALLRAARDILRVSRATAAAWVGVTEGTIQNWEGGASDSALRSIFYLRELAARSDLSRDFVLQILGLGEGVTEGDPELQEWLHRVSVAWENPRRRKAIRITLEGVFEALDVGESSSGESRAASA